jgi:hypothetical protein
MVEVNFIILGRLGNAVYRYMASAIVCILCNGNYVVNKQQCSNLSDNDFYNIFITNSTTNNITVSSVNMYGFYQHDEIYKQHKESIINFIRNNPTHCVLTDGIKAGDSNYQQYFMMDILNTPSDFKKKYKCVLHLRLEDFVVHNLYITKERVVELLRNIKINNCHDINSICIVCNKPETTFEFDYINYVQNFLKQQNINSIFESNDVLTDYYIMKEAEVLICSKSTLSWCAAFFSDKIQTCYFPDYNIDQPNTMTCKSPIDNTILY